MIEYKFTNIKKPTRRRALRVVELGENGSPCGIGGCPFHAGGDAFPLIIVPADPAGDQTEGEEADGRTTEDYAGFGDFGHIGLGGVDPHEFHVDPAAGEGGFIDHAGISVAIMVGRADVVFRHSRGHAGAGHLGKDVSELELVGRQDVGGMRGSEVLEFIGHGVTPDRFVEGERNPPVASRRHDRGRVRSPRTVPIRRPAQGRGRVGDRPPCDGGVAGRRGGEDGSNQCVDGGNECESFLHRFADMVVSRIPTPFVFVRGKLYKVQ